MNWFEFITELPDVPLEKILLKLNLKEFEEVQKIFENDSRVSQIRQGSSNIRQSSTY